MRKVIVICLVFLGILLMVYPMVANVIKEYSKTTVISNYKTEVNLLEDEQKKKKIEEARKYNEQLEKQNYIDISLEEKEENELPSYLDVMGTGDTIGYIQIPKINVNLPIYQGTSKDVLYSGVGHIETSSLPVGGMRYTCCTSRTYRVKLYENF